MTILTITYVTEAPNTLIRSARWNTNFNDITSFINTNLLDSLDNLRPGGITNTSIAANAAIAYSKLNLTGGIVNADINASAAIASTKLDLSSVSQVVAMISKIFKFAKGADVASANTMTLGEDGNFFFITGTTQINTITAKQAGTLVILKFNGALTLSNSGNLKLLNGGSVSIAANDVMELVSDGTNWWQVGDSITSLASGFVPRNIQVFTSSGTWTKPAGVSSVYVKVWGAGGGGSGGSTNTRSGGGGGGGGYSEGFTAVTGNVTVTVGTGGAGATGVNTGTTGGTSSFAGSTTISASGGVGAGPSNGSGGSGGAGGTGSNGQINISGNTGNSGNTVGTTAAYANGEGGSSYGFPGAYPILYPSSGHTDGNAGQGYGAGGSGAANKSDTNGTGGAGSNGLVIVYY